MVSPCASRTITTTHYCAAADPLATEDNLEKFEMAMKRCWAGGVEANGVYDTMNDMLPEVVLPEEAAAGAGAAAAAAPSSLPDQW